MWCTNVGAYTIYHEHAFTSSAHVTHPHFSVPVALRLTQSHMHRETQSHMCKYANAHQTWTTLSSSESLSLKWTHQGMIPSILWGIKSLSLSPCLLLRDWLSAVQAPESPTSALITHRDTFPCSTLPLVSLHKHTEKNVETHTHVHTMTTLCPHQLLTMT